jgi:hypothetical protein
MPRLEELGGLEFAYRSIRDLCDQRGIAFAVAALEPESCGVVRQVCGKLKIPMLDLSRHCEAHFAASGGPALIRFRTDPHYNELGQELIARAIRVELQHMVPARMTSGSPVQAR